MDEVTIIEDIIEKYGVLPPNFRVLLFKKLLQSSTPHEQCRIAYLLDGILKYDVISGAPQLVFEKILTYLSGSDVLSIQLVCRTWCARVNSCRSVWLRLCDELGASFANVSTKGSHELKAHFLQTRRLVSALRNSVCGHQDVVTLSLSGEMISRNGRDSVVSNRLDREGYSSLLRSEPKGITNNCAAASQDGGSTPSSMCSSIIGRSNSLCSSMSETIRRDSLIRSGNRLAELQQQESQNGNEHQSPVECFYVQAHADRITAVVYNEDLGILATGSDDRSVCFYDAHAARGVERLAQFYLGHTVADVKFTSELLLCASFNCLMTLWRYELPSGPPNNSRQRNARSDKKTDGNTKAASGICQCLFTFVGHTRAVLTVDFSTDLQLVVSGSADETVKVWRIPEGALKLSASEAAHFEHQTVTPLTTVDSVGAIVQQVALDVPPAPGVLPLSLCRSPRGGSFKYSCRRTPSPPRMCADGLSQASNLEQRFYLLVATEKQISLHYLVRRMGVDDTAAEVELLYTVLSCSTDQVVSGFYAKSGVFAGLRRDTHGSLLNGVACGSPTGNNGYGPARSVAPSRSPSASSYQQLINAVSQSPSSSQKGSPSQPDSVTDTAPTTTTVTSTTGVVTSATAIASPSASAGSLHSISISLSQNINAIARTLNSIGPTSQPSATAACVRRFAISYGSASLSLNMNASGFLSPLLPPASATSPTSLSFFGDSKLDRVLQIPSALAPPNDGGQRTTTRRDERSNSKSQCGLFLTFTPNAAGSTALPSGVPVPLGNMTLLGAGSAFTATLCELTHEQLAVNDAGVASCGCPASALLLFHRHAHAPQPLFAVRLCDRVFRWGSRVRRATVTFGDSSFLNEGFSEAFLSGAKRERGSSNERDNEPRSNGLLFAASTCDHRLLVVRWSAALGSVISGRSAD